MPTTDSQFTADTPQDARQIMEQAATAARNAYAASAGNGTDIYNYEDRHERLKELAATITGSITAELLNEYTKLQWMQAIEGLKGRILLSSPAAKAHDELCDQMVAGYGLTSFDSKTQQWEKHDNTPEASAKFAEAYSQVRKLQRAAEKAV